MTISDDEYESPEDDGDDSPEILGFEFEKYETSVILGGTEDTKKAVARVNKMTVQELSAPTDLPTGCPARVELYRRRYSKGVSLWILGDRLETCHLQRKQAPPASRAKHLNKGK